MDVLTLIAVGAGGAIGTMARFTLAHAVGWWLGDGFPYATMKINILGSFLMGLLVQSAGDIWSPSPTLLSFFKIGVLGGFTTFSSFSLDAVSLMDHGDWFGLGTYVFGSVAASIGGLIAGMGLMEVISP